MNKFPPNSNPRSLNTDADAGLERTGCADSGAGYLLLTGATGLVGHYLLRDFSLRKHKLAVLVRGNKKFSAQERVESIMAQWERKTGRPLERPVVIEGDLGQPELAISDEDLDWLGQNCDRILHNGAVLKFQGQDRASDPWKTNLGGTERILQLAERLAERSGYVREMHYVSTAYVSGVCDSVFRESDFDVGQDFRNEYERSKFEAEQLVRQSELFDSTTIYRPAVIVGDSETGFTVSYHGLYLYLRLMATLIPLQPMDEDGTRRTEIGLPMSGEEPRNLVPVDWVSRVIVEAICDQQTHSRTYHLVPKIGLTARQLIEYCYEYFNSRGVKFGDCSGANENGNENDFARQYLENMQVYSAYDTSDPVFDRSNIESVFKHLPCPAIDREMIFRFLDFGIKDRWGKRRPEKSTSGKDATDAASLAAKASNVGG